MNQKEYDEFIYRICSIKDGYEQTKLTNFFIKDK